MDIYSYIEDKILANIDDKVRHRISVEQKFQHADISTNAPIILAKLYNKNANEAADPIVKMLTELPEVKEVEFAHPGFLNITIKNEIWQNLIHEINQKGIRYGETNIGNNHVIHMESVSANPTGPLHIGHARSAVFFNSLGKVLEKVGYKIVREYYINDAGSQIDALVHSVFCRYQEHFGVSFPESAMYPGDYLKAIGSKLAKMYGESLLEYDAKSKKIIQDFAIEEMMQSITNDLKLIGLVHDIFISQASLGPTTAEAIDILNKKGLIYADYLTDPKGKKKDDWKAHKHLLFKSSVFGDDADRSLQKQDGSWTYFADDIGYHLNKIERGFHHMMLGLGLDHAGYIKRLESAVRSLSDDIKIEVKSYNIVRLIKNGETLKMSKRSGQFLKLRDLINDVGDADVVKYMMLTRRHDMIIDLDIDKVKEQSQNNPVFYVQYAHARACSVLRQADKNINLNNIDLSVLSTQHELNVIKILGKWPRVIKKVAQTYEPHRIANYLSEIAEAFHALWHCGNQNLSLRFIVSGDKNLTEARASLAFAVKNVISSGLDLLSITGKESM